MKHNDDEKGRDRRIHILQLQLYKIQTHTKLNKRYLEIHKCF